VKAIEVPLNNLQRANKSLGSLVFDSVIECIDSGEYIGGKSVLLFESKLANYLDMKHLISVGNGSDALEIAIASCDLKKGSKILCTANAGGYATNAILRCGMFPQFVDIDSNSGNMSPESLKATIKEGGAFELLIFTNLYGSTQNALEIRKLCDEFGLKMLEDCAQSFGARVSNDKEAGQSGSLGDLAVYSFFPTKPLGGIGDGGAIATNSDVLSQRARAMRQYGWSEKYSIDVLGGQNSRLDSLQASFLSKKLDLSDSLISKRVEILSLYHSLLDSKNILSIADSTTSAHLAVIRVNNRKDVRGLAASLGIETGIHYPILDTNQKAWSHLLNNQNLNIPNTIRLNNSILTIPLFDYMFDGEIEMVCSFLSKLEQETWRV
jgi:dTDP-4-amino-4,6-dideoxygalactose transaminase